VRAGPQEAAQPEPKRFDGVVEAARLSVSGPIVQARTNQLMISLTRVLWAVAAGMALGLLAILATRMTGTPAVGWGLLIVVVAAAYVGTARTGRL
jgi:hypothetical protein